MNKNYVIGWIEKNYDDFVKIRRHLHMYPEIGRHEFMTQKFICDFLKKEGIKFKKIADTGVLALIEGQPGGKTVALRSDIDALPTQEANVCEYRSVNDGFMHSCGHDAHMAINLACARFFAQHQAEFAGTVKLFFQPDEEGKGGAARIIEEGGMENPHVDYVLGLHVMPYLDWNKIEVKNGALYAAVDAVNIRFRGKSGHGAYPETATDAINMAAQFVVSAQSILSRNISPVDSAVFTIGKINGGDARNIICDEVNLACTIRSSDQRVRSKMFERVTGMADGVAHVFGGTAEIEFENSYIALINDNDVMDIVRDEAAACLGKANVIEKEFICMGGEDFAFFCEKAPSAFYSVGCRIEDKPEYGLHSRIFDVDERCIKTGAAVEIMTALRLMRS